MTTRDTGPALSGVIAGRFEVGRLLGSGGMGAVYAARDVVRDAHVALKTLPRVDPHALYRFKQEFRLLAGISHPNLAALHELLSAGDQWFLTMELVEGVDFLSHVRGDSAGPDVASSDLIETAYVDPAARGGAPRAVPGASFDVARLRTTMHQLTGALAALHAADRLHLDIKPSNVMVTGAGRVVVLDFGLVTDRSSGATAPGEPVVGTVGYMAPEQAAGAALTPAADWYAVGAMLYQALTGRLPFEGSVWEVLAAKATSQPIPPRRLNPSLPDAFDRICMGLLATRPADRATGADLLLAMTGEGAAAAPPRRGPSPITVGRGREIGQLQDALDDTAAGRPISVYIHAASGMGKSALIEGFLESVRARPEALVLAGRCYEQESVQYKAIDGLIDALMHHLQAMPEADLRSVLPSDVALLALLFPVLDRVGAIRDAPRDVLVISSEQELRDRAFDALRRLLGALASRWRLVLSIDDLQWGDTDSARLLHELLHGPLAPPLLFVGGYRSEHSATSACLATLLADPVGSPADAAARAPDRRTIALGPLEVEHARQLALDWLGPDVPEAHATAARIAGESGGSPYFVRALVEYVKAELQFADPGAIAEGITLDEALRRRLGRLRPAARRLLEVIAVASRPIAEADAYAAADLPSRDPAVIGVLRNSHLVQSGGADDPQVEAYHDRIRESVIALLPAATLRQTHRRLAATLEARGNVDPEWVGAHLEGAGDAARAANCFAQAAASAAAALAFDRAAELYRRSLRLGTGDQPESVFARGVHLGDALANAGRGSEAADAYLESARFAPAREVMDLRRRAGYQMCISGRLAEGRALLAECLKQVGVSLPASSRRALLPLLVGAFRLRLLEWTGGFERPVSRPTPTEADRTRLAILWAASAALSDVDVMVSAALSARHLLLARKLGDPTEITRGLALYSRWVPSGVRGRRRRLAIIAAARRFAELAGGGPYERAMVTISEAWAHCEAYDWTPGFAAIDKAEDLLRNCTGVTWELLLVRMTRVTYLRTRGRYRAGVEYGKTVLATAAQRGDVYTQTVFGMIVVPDEMELDGDFTGARKALQRIVGRSARRQFPTQRLLFCLRMITIDMLLDQRSVAWRRSRRYWPIMMAEGTMRVDVVKALAYAARAASALGAIDDLPAQSASLLVEAEKAIRVLERMQAGLAQGFAMKLRGSLALRRGDPSRALTHFGQAAEWFESHGFEAFAAASRHSQGLALGGEDGRRMVSSALAWFEAQHVHPSHLVNSHCAGLPRGLLQEPTGSALPRRSP